MLHKTSGIILHITKYSETSLIVKIYTGNFGLQSYMINGVRGKKSKMKANLFQPLALVEMVVSNSNKGNLQRISEINILHPYTAIPYDMVKSSIAIFLNEILYRALQEEHSENNIFEFIKNSLLILDLKQENCSNFHIFFMIQLSRYLGFYPQGKHTPETSIFDLQEGRFIAHTPSIHSHYLTDSYSILLHDFINCSYENIHQLQLDKNQRKQMLNALIIFYQLHVPSFREIKSQTILQQVIE
jgi:DNA repair protein RecO (recombination protein O)